VAAPNPVDKVKLWIFPSLVSVIGLFIYQEIKEVKADVKQLLTQSSVNKTRIDNLEREVFKTTSVSYPYMPVEIPQPEKPTREATLPEERRLISKY